MPYPTPNKAARDALFKQAQQPDTEESLTPGYAIETRKVASRFLLVCEGENTERYYFEAFPVPTKTVEVVGGYSGDKMYLVNEAKKLSEKSKYEGYEVWCIFDYDVKYGHPNQKQDYDNAIAGALQNDFKVAFSNDCFELWFVLHYKAISSEHHRTEYYEMLSKEWKALLKGGSYESCGKDIDFSKDLYKQLLPLQPEALKRAKQLHNNCSAGSPYHQMNPCTTVYELVGELNDNLASGFRK